MLAHRIEFAFAASVPAGKEGSREAGHVPDIRYGPAQLGRSALEYIEELFHSSGTHCKVEIQFNGNDNQTNAVRTSLVNIASTDDQIVKRGEARTLAERLYSVTDDRNKTGLLAIVEGRLGASRKILLMRFREDEVIRTASLSDGSIDLEVIVNAFTKRSVHYKAALFEDRMNRSMYWKGKIVDKQTTGGVSSVSNYWMVDFLDARSAFTPKQGTRVLAKYLKLVVDKLESLEEKQAVIAASLLLNQHAGEVMSIQQFADRFLGPDLSRKFTSYVNSDVELESVFEVDRSELDVQIANAQLSLSNGVEMLVPRLVYDQSVQERANSDGGVDVTVTGTLVNRKLKRK